ncbi:MAG: ion transporter [Myxococcota bacterium]
MRYFIVGTATRSGRIADVVLIFCIAIGVMALILESIPEFMQQHHSALRLVERGVGIVFVGEYALRLWVARRKRDYIFSFWGVVDLLAVLPFVFQGFDLAYFRLFRVLRIFSILKVGHYMSAASLLLDSLAASHTKIGVFLFTVSVLVLVLAFTMHEVEPQTFRTIPDAIWWVVVTITTVGYGDLVPVTALGRLIAGVAMIVAFGIIAVPTGIVAAEYNLQLQGRSSSACGGCGRNRHDKDAQYCASCGKRL